MEPRKWRDVPRPGLRGDQAQPSLLLDTMLEVQRRLELNILLRSSEGLGGEVDEELARK